MQPTSTPVAPKRQTLSLLRQGSPLATPQRQVAVLEDPSDVTLPTFDAVLADRGLSPMRSTGIEVLQVNLGKLCNQTCRHCHVDAGPDRREVMSRETVDACLDVLRRTDIPTLDITGGAPEMNPHFRHLVSEAHTLGRQVIDRSNLTILVTPGHTDLPEFLADHEAEVVASLPCYLEENCDRQRGDGVFRRSLEAIRRLNAVGYGVPGSGLVLTLVFNPVGPSLPPPQDRLEADYHRELAVRYGVSFTRLFTITNMPISRFLNDLLDAGQFERYMRTLVDAFNPATVHSLMCRNTLSVDWQGRLFDCDFNQMLDLGIARSLPSHITDFDPDLLATRKIVTGRHCFGCTAGTGSSCQGSLTDSAATP